MEQEAIALGQLDILYHNLLSAVNYKAKDCVKRSIHLADSLHPKTFHTESEWCPAADTTEAHWYQGSYIKLSGGRHLKVSGGRHLKVSGGRHLKLSGGRHLKLNLYLCCLYFPICAILCVFSF